MNVQQEIISKSNLRRCLFYRKSETLSVCWGTGYCGLDESRAKCKGIVQSCKDPTNWKRYFLKQDRVSPGLREPTKRNNVPKSMIALPLEYRKKNETGLQAGVTGDLSDTGSVVYSVFRDLCIGDEIMVRVLFANGFALDSFKGIAAVVSKKAHIEKDWKGYLYGLAFLHLSREDREKLRLVCAGEESPEGRVERRAVLAQRAPWGPGALAGID